MIFLVGKQDLPTDGVQDYCEYLGKALRKYGIRVEIVRVDGVSEGWLRALRKLSNSGRNWRGHWVVLQYTAMAWSARGFPFGALIALMVAKCRSARCAVVFHEPVGFDGPRRIDRIRGACQNWVVQRLHDMAERSIFPDPLETVKWLPAGDRKAISIPIGANIPEDETVSSIGAEGDAAREDDVRKVVVYCLSDPPHLYRELAEISEAARLSATNGTKLRVTFLGRGTAEAANQIRKAFDKVPAEVLNLGVRASREVKRTIAESDVMLCVRGPLYPRRGSALAGIACGLPIIGYAGEAENTPIADAGLMLVPYHDTAALGFALARVLKDRSLSGELREKSLRAHRQHFTWDSIAAKVAAFLGTRPE